MKRYTIFIALVWLLFLNFLANAQEQLSLDQAIVLSLQGNYAIKIAQKMNETNENNDTWGNAGAMPIITTTITGSGRTENVRQKFISGAINDRNGAATRNFNANLNFAWTLYNGGAMFINKKRFMLMNDLSQNNLKLNIERTIFQVCSAYFNIIQQQQRLKSLENNLLISQQRLDLAKSKYEIGTGSKVEYLNAQVDFNSDKSNILNQKQQITNAKISLNELLVRDLGADFVIQDSIQLENKLSWETLSQEAKNNNLNLKSLQMQKEMSVLNLRATEAQRLPQVDFNSNLNFNYATSQAGFLATNRNLGLGYGITATFNIFNGFNQNRLEENAKLNVLMQDYQTKNQSITLESEILQTYKNYENSLLLTNIEKENLAIARQNVDIALERYKVGVATPLELRETQRNIIITESRLIEAIFTTKITELNLFRLSGGLVNKAETK